jgi:A/G-specific adenine glycosylase
MTDSQPGTQLPDHVLQKIRGTLVEWRRETHQEYPWRDPERDWHGLAAEILLQRTRADSVVPVYREFVRRFPEPADLGEASEEEILDVMGTLGLHWRAPLLKKLGKALAERGGIPQTMGELRDLPGVGDYVASAYLSFHAGRRGVLVDSNIVRWVCRLLGREYDGETRREEWLQAFLERLTPEDGHRHFNYAMLDFAMEVCTPNSPACADCPIGSTHCTYGADRLSGAEDT